MPRKKEFEPEVALDRAMRYFWVHGYHDTSIRDLISGTGVNFYGLYKVFGDKRGIYMNSLEHYHQTFIKQICDAALNQSEPIDKIKSIFNQVAKIAITENFSAGCMICNATIELAPHDEGVLDIVQSHRKQLEYIFSDLLKKAPKEVENIPELSEFLTTQVYMIGFLARSKGKEDQISRHIKVILSLLGNI